jgi:hypothetical protein
MRSTIRKTLFVHNIHFLALAKKLHMHIFNNFLSSNARIWFNLISKPHCRTWGHARKHAKSAHQNRLLLIGSRIRVWVLLRNKHNQPTLNSSLAPGETWMAKRINLHTCTAPAHHRLTLGRTKSTACIVHRAQSVAHKIHTSSPLPPPAKSKKKNPLFQPVTWLSHGTRAFFSHAKTEDPCARIMQYLHSSLCAAAGYYASRSFCPEKASAGCFCSCFYPRALKITDNFTLWIGNVSREPPPCCWCFGGAAHSSGSTQ